MAMQQKHAKHLRNSPSPQNIAPSANGFHDCGLSTRTHTNQVSDEKHGHAQRAIVEQLNDDNSNDDDDNSNNNDNKSDDDVRISVGQLVQAAPGCCLGHCAQSPQVASSPVPSGRPPRI
jgi:hypothetical protein